MDFYDFNYTSSTGNEISFNNYKGKIVLIVNTAIHDSFSSQYKELEKIYRKFKEYDFEILDFPCDQFHGMTPESDEEISEILEKEYEITFPRFLKCEVKGNNKIELYKYLTSKKSFKGLDITHPMAKVINSINIKEGILNDKKNNEIRWNFTKFLIDRNGKVVKRFEVTQNMQNIIKSIQDLINKQPQIKINEKNGLINEIIK